MYGDTSWMEPDIDGRNANGDPVEYNFETHSYEVVKSEPSIYQSTISEPYYMYQFTSKEHLMSSSVFQEALSQSMAFKDKVIQDLQNELLNLGC